MSNIIRKREADICNFVCRYFSYAVEFEMPDGRDLARLMSIARSLSALDVAQCNREMTKADLFKTKRLQDEAREIVAAHGVEYVYFSYEPMAYAIRLYWNDHLPPNWNTARQRDDLDTTSGIGVIE